jgi:hypothetical protein
MAKDASAALGAPEVVGSFVNAKGLKKLTRASGPAVVGATGAPELPSFGRVGYVAVTRDEIAVVKARNSFLHMTVGDQVLARVSRSAIAKVEFDGGALLSHLTITFANDVTWQFDIPKLNKRSTEAVVRELGGTV